MRQARQSAVALANVSVMAEPLTVRENRVNHQRVDASLVSGVVQTCPYSARPMRDAENSWTVSRVLGTYTYKQCEELIATPR